MRREAEQVISLATTIPVTMPDTLHFCADGGAHPLLGALPAFGLWSGEMVNEDTLFVTQEEGLFDLTYSFVSPDGCPSEGTTVAQVVAVLSLKLPPPTPRHVGWRPLCFNPPTTGFGLGKASMPTAPFKWPHLAPTPINLPSEGSCYAFDEVEVTFLPLPSSDILTSLQGTSTPLCSDEPLPIHIAENTSQRTTLSMDSPSDARGCGVCSPISHSNLKTTAPSPWW